MHILFVAPAYAPFVGGAQTFLRAMARRFVADGYRVTVLTTNARRASDFWQPPGDEPLPRRTEREGVTVIRLPLRYPWPAPYRFGLLRRAGHWLHHSGLPDALQCSLLGYLANYMPPLASLQFKLDQVVPEVDLVQAVDGTWDGLFTAAGHAAHRYGKPFVAVPLVHTGSARIVAHFLMAHQVETYRQADAVLALSQREARRLAGQGVARSRLHVLPMGVDPFSSPISPQKIAAFRCRHNLSGPLVAFVGATTYDKGAFTLLEAIAHLNRNGVDTWLACAGPEQERLADFLSRQPPQTQEILGKRVRLLGIVTEEEKQCLLAACDLLALPSRVDSFGIVLLEAALHAKPVVVANVGGLPETARSNETGLLVPFGNVMALAGALERLLAEPALVERLGSAGRRRVLQGYTWDHTYELLREIYAQIDIPDTHSTGRGITVAAPAGRRSSRDG